MKNPRLINYEYFELSSLPIGEIPYSTIQRALKDEKYLRKFAPTFCRNDLKRGHVSALLYWYPYYIEQLYELAVEGINYMTYFVGLPEEISEAFKVLFKEIFLKLEKAKTLATRLTELDELDIKRRRPNYKVT